MTAFQILPLLATLSVSLVCGALLGMMYFTAVRMTADLIVTGNKPMVAIALTFGRFGLIGAGLIIAVQAGAIAVLAALAGVLLGRNLMIRRPERADVCSRH